MTKKVAKRGWSLEKFSDAVKNACEKQGTKFSSAKCKQAYEDGLTVAYAAAKMGQAPAEKSEKRVSAKKAA